MSKKVNAGFTLIELLIVIAVVGILVTGLLIVINPMAQLAKGRDAGRRTAAKQIVDAVERYQITYGSYPDSWCWWCNSQGGPRWITGLVDRQELKKVPIDPVNNWGSGKELIYYYTSDGADYCLQVGFETDVSSDPDYNGYWSNTWKLRFGPNGPRGGLCGSR